MQAKTDILETPVRYFKGVGPKRCEHLLRLGIKTASDLLYYLPSRYEDRSNFTAIKDLKTGEKQTIRGEVLAMSTRLTKRGMPVFEMAVGDKTGRIPAVWFNQPFLTKFFKVGQEIILYGKVERFGALQINQPEYEIIKEDEEASLHIGRIVPIYPLTSQITQRYLRGLVYMAIAKYGHYLADRLPTYIRARHKLADIRFAAYNIHFPSSFANLDKAYKRIVFEEFFMLQLAFAIKRRNIKAESGISHRLEGALIKSFTANLPFELTKGQKDAMNDIGRDMASARPMNRLLEGDVGSGKTAVAAYALVLTVENGLQGAIMAPTEVLARQHYLVLSKLLMPLGINVALLARGIDESLKAQALNEISQGKVNIVVGTHAVIQEGVEFKALGLAVIDEQHKFGVEQRAVLRRKGKNPHVLVMTATPIPRTLALTVYGDLDVSIIRELPKGRRPIVTYWVDEDKRQKVYDFIKDEAAGGRQAYIVCPLIDGSASIEGSVSKGAATKSATEMHEKLSREVFRDYKVGLIHGRMGPKEKAKVMKEFRDGGINILIATVVIEVGIDVPNASVMVIENAEKFGLAQLHQLRGRIGRGDCKSYCILLADPRNENAKKRLMAIEDTVDGFEIAEEDLALRGPGEFFGASQHGLPEIRFGNIVKDFSIMEEARKAAFDVVNRDPMIRDEHHKYLRDTIVSRFKGRLELIRVG